MRIEWKSWRIYPLWDVFRSRISEFLIQMQSKADIFGVYIFISLQYGFFFFFGSFLFCSCFWRNCHSFLVFTFPVIENGDTKQIFKALLKYTKIYFMYMNTCVSFLLPHAAKYWHMQTREKAHLFLLADYFNNLQWEFWMKIKRNNQIAILSLAQLSYKI